MREIIFSGYEPIVPQEKVPIAVIYRIKQYHPHTKPFSNDIYQAVKRLLTDLRMRPAWIAVGKLRKRECSETLSFIIDAYRKRKSGLPYDRQFPKTEQKEHFRQISRSASRLRTLLLNKRYTFIADLFDEEVAFLSLPETLAKLEALAKKMPKDRVKNSMFPGVGNINKLRGRNPEQQMFCRNLCIWFHRVFKKPMDEINAIISSVLFPQGKELHADDVRKYTKGFRHPFKEDS